MKKSIQLIYILNIGSDNGIFQLVCWKGICCHSLPRILALLLKKKKQKNKRQNFTSGQILFRKNEMAMIFDVVFDCLFLPWGSFNLKNISAQQTKACSGSCVYHATQPDRWTGIHRQTSPEAVALNLPLPLNQLWQISVWITEESSLPVHSNPLTRHPNSEYGVCVSAVKRESLSKLSRC